MVQFNVQKTDGAYHVDHEYMEISTHLVTYLHRQKPVPSTQHPGLGTAEAIVLHSSFLDQLPWGELRSNFRNVMQTPRLADRSGELPELNPECYFAKR